MEAQAGGLCDLEGNPEGKRGELSRPGGGGGDRPWGPPATQEDIYILFEEHQCPSNSPVLSRGVT